ncbi:hypothetical protein HMPREF1985_02089 [Mitsuokella sp. oral taxon 131 str. W9106]|nr:hypothetical protein HMPREF1985_02089 [Mitsuokella sp. oral taxon 131 str. W9106]
MGHVKAELSHDCYVRAGLKSDCGGIIGQDAGIPAAGRTTICLRRWIGKI